MKGLKLTLAPITSITSITLLIAFFDHPAHPFDHAACEAY